MFSSLTTKLALRKLGLNSDSLNFSSPTAPDPKPKKLTKNAPPGTVPGLDDVDDDDSSTKWPAWMTVKSLPLTVQPWLSPPPPPIPVAAECPKPGDLAPLDRDRKLTFGGGKKVLVVFLRCVGCAFAQKTFLHLRALANKYPTISCIAISHSSPTATQKWIDLVGGAWNVSVVIDEDRAVYAAWGLGLGSVWYVLNPTTQVQGWKEKGWLGASVAGAITRTGVAGVGKSALDVEREGRRAVTGTVGGGEVVGEGGPTTTMGNKWQQAGAWAVDGRGTVVWGGKAARADDVLDLEGGVRALGL
ncbi:hypothetical protein CONLIGDRAFT_291450 [Coniochaeta ligniaria NRRL 30616]|uniref:Alkyl hydroperoxide reductase subunit C/ Thiol specific antioxidant domain-containing protein n=1 Tax=Coniochaeta ligniaria NRRL 30616 TaxID=1408157 RepID=A0A1J7JND8_9PEZI|nr:hypothetical protein CONLIGDRAFT_291450 [Coniochaeta ligniaria NRRL 30616]